MTGETIVVQTAPKPDSEPQSQQPVTPVETQAVQTQATIIQAENYGAMSEAFRRSQEEAAQMRSELHWVKEEQQKYQEMYRDQMNELKAQNTRLLQAIEEEEEGEIQLPDGSNGQTTVITPPVITPPLVVETTPKKKQSRMNQILFGKDDEEE